VRPLAVEFVRSFCLAIGAPAVGGCRVSLFYRKGRGRGAMQALCFLLPAWGWFCPAPSPRALRHGTAAAVSMLERGREGEKCSWGGKTGFERRSRSQSATSLHPNQARNRGGWASSGRHGRVLFPLLIDGRWGVGSAKGRVVPGSAPSRQTSLYSVYHVRACVLKNNIASESENIDCVNTGARAPVADRGGVEREQGSPFYMSGSGWVCTCRRFYGVLFAPGPCFDPISQSAERLRLRFFSVSPTGQQIAGSGSDLWG